MGIEFLLEMAEAADPDRVLIGSRADGITARELSCHTAEGARQILSRGVEEVAFIGVNGPAFPMTVLAAARAGIPVTPLNYRLTEAAIREQLARLDRPLVIADETFVRSVGSDVDVITTADWSALVAGQETTTPGDLVPVDEDAIAVTLFTSGTTSTPKRVVLRHRNLVSYVLQTVEFAHADQDDAALVSVPPYHVAAVGTILTNLYAGRRVAYLPNFSAAEWVELVATERIGNAMLVPTMLTRIVDHLAEHPAALPSLRSIAYGGARITRPVLEKALTTFPAVAFTNAYGLTETSSTIAVLTPEDHRESVQSDDPRLRERLTSAGRMVPGVEAVVRALDGSEAPAGTVGELWVRGPQVSGEYVGTGSTLDAEGWFPTRDLAHLDEAGYLFIHGRSDDTIIRGGENISPAEIEDVLIEHPGVRDVAVVGVADAEWGHRIRAVVVLEDAVPFDSEGLRSWVRERLRGSRTPDEVIAVVELPYSPTGKLLRSTLASPLEQLDAG